MNDLYERVAGALRQMEANDGRISGKKATRSSLVATHASTPIKLAKAVKGRPRTGALPTEHAVTVIMFYRVCFLSRCEARQATEHCCHSLNGIEQIKTSVQKADKGEEESNTESAASRAQDLRR
jgi:hypothetical protein